MVRWIAFDDETAEAVVSRFRRGAAEIEHGDLLGIALGSEQPTVMILPTSTPGRVLLAKVVPAVQTVTYEPTGFLGLSDEPVLRTQPRTLPAQNESWVKRLLRRIHLAIEQ
jgi:hypothetical protein